ncbi:MAG: DNA translocase FtsK [Bacteroidales bacterium]|nr:DNA translocase FtsK [Bacteroidales bacterium]
MKKTKRKISIFSFWKDMPEEKKDRILFISGLVFTCITALVIIASLSYVFSWKVDGNLLNGTAVAEGKAEGVRNAGGMLGFRIANGLVGNSFGFASFVLAGYLFALSLLLVVKKRFKPSLRRFVAVFSGTYLLSLLLAYISTLAGTDAMFLGNGLGGGVGFASRAWLCRMIGVIPTGILLAVLICIWLLMVSRRFSAWLMSLGKEEDNPEIDMDGVEEAAQELDESDDPGQDFEDIVFETDEPEEPEIIVPPVVAPVQAPQPAAVPQKAETPIEVFTDDTLDAEVKKDLPPINNRDELPQFKAPSLTLLNDYAGTHHEVTREEIERNNNKIRQTLASYNIMVDDVQAIVGATVTLYKVYPSAGVKIASIRSRQEDIAISMNARGVRVVTLSDSVGIEVANDTPSVVPLKKMLNDPAYRESKAELPVAIGYTITQKVKVFDLADAPHLLIAGATKQGKSVGLNVIVSSLLYSKHPSELKFVFIDPKMVEFSSYAKMIHHYLAVLPTSSDAADEMSHAIIKNAKDAAAVLQSLCIEMDERYLLLSKAYVNNIKLYNEKYKSRHLLPTDGHRFLPYLVVVVDEYADLTMSAGAGPEAKAQSRGITQSIIRLAQKGRAAGIHVILATQRPTVDVVTGLIKANFPWRIAFRVTSRIDSQTILDTPGAEKLIGRGDMLLYTGIDMERIQCALIGNDEIASVTDSIWSQQGYKKSYNTPYYLPEPPSESNDGPGEVDMKNIDDHFEDAARLIVQNQRGSTSDLQRRLGMGYARAGKVMDQLEAAGIVGPQNGSKPREVLVKDFRELDEILSHFLGQ